MVGSTRALSESREGRRVGHVEIAQSAVLPVGYAGREVTGESCSETRFIHREPELQVYFPAARPRASLARLLGSVLQ
jgi:hypothetical protein